MKLQLLTLGAAALSATLAQAQVTVIATESFEYNVPGLLGNNTGGTGWSSAWEIDGMGNEIVLFDQTINPPMTCPDAVGNYVGQASEFIAAYRQPDLSQHADITENGLVGRDGATVWVSFRTQQYQVFGDSFGALQLFLSTDPMEEELLLGSPWASNAWGIDSEGGSGQPPIFDPNTNAATCAKLVFRIDHLPGMERVRMWVDPVLDYPLDNPNVDTMITDLRWDEIRLNSGGSGTHFFWDDIVIAKGEPTGSIGTSYCGPAVVNSSGTSATIVARGSNAVVDNDVELFSSNLPALAFGFSIVSTTTGFAMNPGGSSGNLCLSGAVGRYVGAGQIMNSGTAGEITLPIDLTQTPQPNGFESIMAGQSWSFQTWFRDSTPGGMPTSNFTDGVTVLFN